MSSESSRRACRATAPRLHGTLQHSLWPAGSLAALRGMPVSGSLHVTPLVGQTSLKRGQRAAVLSPAPRAACGEVRGCVLWQGGRGQAVLVLSASAVPAPWSPGPGHLLSARASPAAALRDTGWAGKAACPLVLNPGITAICLINQMFNHCDRLGTQKWYHMPGVQRWVYRDAATALAASTLT